MACIVVLGAGVVGLTTALQLSREGKYTITVVAKHQPGDYDIEYASPWAGANYLPVGTTESLLGRAERATWPELARLTKEVPEAGIHFQPAFLYNRKKDKGTATEEWFKELLRPDAWFKDVVPNFRILDQSELSPEMDTGTSFTSVCMNPAIYLPWLAGQCLKNGVVIKRGIVSHICDAARMHHSGQTADIVVNCTGLSSLKLGGVEDTKLYPGRGQIVVVRNECGRMVGTSGTDDDADEALYIMTRAAGGGTILGGSLQKGNWESQPDLNLAARIMKRCVDLCPDLTGGKGPEALSIVRHAVGLRPLRDGGIRVEKEVIDGLKVVHNYGHGGYGYQSSYGTADMVVKLVKESLQ